MSASPPSPADPIIGLRVGSFVIEKLLGMGGMGAVYIGLQPDLGKRVAIKFLSDEFNANQGVIARFFQEARAVNVIGHENIVDIFDFGQVAGRNYFVMELLDGRSLEVLLREDRALSPARALDIARQIASGLAAAHGNGIVHRDLKPDNVHLVRRAGRSDFVKILDFGIAKLTSLPSGEIGRTQTGMVLGTPGYMAPEQAGGSIVDHRADVYALGVLLYRMLAGQIPFPGDNFAQILRRQLMEEPRPIGELRADVPKRLDELVLRMLSREQAERPQTMEEIDEILDEISREKLSDSVMWYTAPVHETDSMRRTRSAPTLAPDASMPRGQGTKQNTQAGRKPDEMPSRLSESLASVEDEGPQQGVLRRGGNSTMWIAGAITILLGGGVAGITLLRPTAPAPVADPAVVPPGPTAPTPPVTTTPTPTPPAPTPPEVVAAPPPVVAKGFTLHVETDPPGAQILDAKQVKIGTTPADLTLEAEAPLTVRLKGFADEKIDAKPGLAPAKIVLKKRPIVPAVPGAPGAPGTPAVAPPADEAPAVLPRLRPGVTDDDGDRPPPKAAEPEAPRKGAGTDE